MASLADLVLQHPVDPSSNGQKTELTKVFAEEPVPLDVFVQDKAFLHNPMLSVEQYNAVRFAERVFYPDLYPVMAQEFGDYWSPIRMVNFIDLMWGKGSGKDHICRLTSMRIAYLVLCLRNPQEYFDLPSQDTIHLLNVASSATQASRAFFEPITRAVKRGWFKDRCEPHRDTVSWEKNVESISGHSDAETQEGLNLLLGVADEIDAFKTRDELERHRAGATRDSTKSLETILEMLRTSASTRFPTTYKNMRISYPRFLGSPIQTLVNRARADIEEKGEVSRYYVSGPLPTWKVNPRLSKVPMVTVPGVDEPVPEVYEEDFRKDPAMAKGKYLCRPERAVNPYFRNEAAVDGCAREDAPVTIDYRLARTSHGVQVWDPVYLFADSFRPVIGAKYSMHGDLAKNGDRAGIAMAHVTRWEEFESISEDEEGGLIARAEVRPYVKVDFVIPFTADLSAQPVAREIQIRWARQLCFVLLERGFNIQRFTYDGWQSTDSMQILTSRGIESELLSIDRTEDPYRTLRDLLYEQRVSYPADPLLRTEVLSIRRTVQGKLDHPPGGSKDLSDALAGACVGALTLGGQEDEGEPTAYPADARFELVSTGDFTPLGLDSLAKTRW